MLELDAVSKRYPARPEAAVLAGLSLSVARGETVAIVGESGSGKSTLLNLIAGLERPDAGTVRVDGTDLAALDDDALTALRRRRYGFVFQAFHVLPHLTVRQNVALPLQLNGVAAADARERVAAMLGSVGLAARGEAWPGELSGGELQRVAIARALVHEPAIVLADEPTGNLDAASARSILALLRETLGRSGATGVLVTHSESAAASADRCLELAAGRLEPVVARAPRAARPRAGGDRG